MSHSYCQILVHAVFSTDGRRNLIPENMEDRLWAYTSATAKKDDIRTIAVGGISNHAHVFFALPATVTLATAMMNLKANSSRWMGEQGINFAWQKGYGAFSVSASHVDDVIDYIKHPARTSQEEKLRRRIYRFVEEVQRGLRSAICVRMNQREAQSAARI